MKMETRTKVTEHKVWIAEDGKEFSSEGECSHYEKKVMGLQIIYIITDRGDRGQIEFVCALDTFENAQQVQYGLINQYGEHSRQTLQYVKCL